MGTALSRGILHAQTEEHSFHPVSCGVSLLCFGYMSKYYSVLTIYLGVIGPRRMFGPGAMYAQIQWFWLIGALLPAVFYVLIRVFPRSKLRLLNAPV
jgi:hypothetical protein